MYTKNLKTDGIGFIFNSNIDFVKIKKITGISSFQVCEPKEEKETGATNLLFFWKNKYHILKFDFKNKSFYINDIKFTVSETDKYIFKKLNIRNHFQAIDGINGLYQYFIRTMDQEDIFSYQVFKTLTIWSNQEPKEI